MRSTITAIARPTETCQCTERWYVPSEIVVGLVEEMNGFLDGSSSPIESLLVNGKLMTAGVDGLAESEDRQIR